MIRQWHAPSKSGRSGWLTRPLAQLFRRAAVESPPVTAAPPVVEEAVRGPGQPLDASTRALMEPRFGQDLSQVRVHTGPTAAESAEAVNALAYTIGRDVVFGAGQYAPGTGEGQRLLAHELAHVAKQHEAAPTSAPSISRSGDAQEVAADLAAAEVLEGRSPHLGVAGQPAALHRQVPGTSATALQQSQGDIVVESFLNRMWEAQSKQEKPFRLTPKVVEGLNLIFPFGAPIGPLTIYPSVSDFMPRLRGKIPATVDPNVIAVLDRLPTQEKPLPRVGPPSGEPAASKSPAAGAEAAKGMPDPRKPPEAGKGAEEAAKKALEAAFEEFRKTKLGQELEKAVKSYVFSKEGIPLVILVVGGALTFVALNDPKLPSVPEIPLGDGIKLKFEYQGRASDLPPLLRALAKGEPEPTPPPGKGEVKVGVSVTVTFEAMAHGIKAIGHFFAEAAEWIAKGVVTVGTVIGKAAAGIKWELLGLIGGAGLGALIGGLAGGGLGAGIGALVGAGIGLGAALVKRLVE